MPNLRAAFLGLAASIGIAAPVSADSDATLQQIYDQARTGHLDQAQQMINQVLMDHPRSARAHFVAAELASRAGNLTSRAASCSRRNSSIRGCILRARKPFGP